MSHAGAKQLLLDLNDERGAFLSILPAERGERILAAWAVAISFVAFAAVAPFAKTQLAPVPAFLPAYQSALVVTDLITAMLLFGQFAILRLRPLLLLAGAYLFSALMALLHALSFPGLFVPQGVLPTGPQTTAWLYFLWHGGFPMLVIVYAASPARGVAVLRPSGSILACIAAVAAAAAACAVLTTWGHGLLPSIMQGDRDADTKVLVAVACWTFSIAALYLLWRRRPQSVLDLWLMVVMCAWIFDIALAAVLNAGRFDVGWYAGRVYGLLAGTFVLVVLLVDNALLYRRLAGAYAGERRERQLAQERGAELQAANKELDAFSYSVSHDLRAPLRAVDGFARMLEEDYAGRLDDEGRRLLGVVRSSTKRMGGLIDDLLEFSRLGRHPPRRSRVDMTALAREAAAPLAAAAPAAEVRIDELPEAVVDRALLKQVWCNLIDNALKYSSKRDRAQVGIGARREPGESVYWVRDNGAGFDMRYAERLFGVFQRLHHASEFPGSGVGLAIVHRVVTRHGGRVWAEAEPGRGACFYFALPDPGPEADTG